MCKKCREEKLMANCSVCLVGKKKMEARLSARINSKKATA